MQTLFFEPRTKKRLYIEKIGSILNNMVKTFCATCAATGYPWFINCVQYLQEQFRSGNEFDYTF